MVCERSEYVPLYNQQIEECLKQLYVFMVEPSQIAFEDEVIMNVRQLIRRNKKVSPVQWDILQQLPKTLAKNKESFG